MPARTAARASVRASVRAHAPRMASVAAGASRDEPTTSPVTASPSPTSDPSTRKTRVYSDTTRPLLPMTRLSPGRSATPRIVRTTSPPTPIASLRSDRERTSRASRRRRPRREGTGRRSSLVDRVRIRLARETPPDGGTLETARSFGAAVASIATAPPRAATRPAVITCSTESGVRRGPPGRGARQ